MSNFFGTFVLHNSTFVSAQFSCVWLRWTQKVFRVRAVCLCRASSQLLDSQAVTTPGAGPRRPKPLTVNDLENFYPPVAFRLGNDGIPSILPLLISEGSRGVLVNEFVHFLCLLCLLCLSSSVELYKGNDRDDYEPKRHAEVPEGSRSIVSRAVVNDKPASYRKREG